MVGNDDGQWWLVRWVRWWVRTVGNLVRAGCSGMQCASSRRVVDIITWSAHYFDLHHDYFARHQDDPCLTILQEFSAYVPINQRVVGANIFSKCGLAS